MDLWPDHVTWNSQTIFTKSIRSVIVRNVVVHRAIFITNQYYYKPTFQWIWFKKIPLFDHRQHDADMTFTMPVETTWHAPFCIQNWCRAITMWHKSVKTHLLWTESECAWVFTLYQLMNRQKLHPPFCTFYPSSFLRGLSTMHFYIFNKWKAIFPFILIKVEKVNVKAYLLLYWFLNNITVLPPTLLMVVQMTSNNTCDVIRYVVLTPLRLD